MSESDSDEYKPDTLSDWEILSDTSQETIRLIEAVYEGDINVVKAMLESGLADVNYCDKNGTTLVHVAISAKNIDMLKVLLNFQPDLSSRNAKKCSPTWLATLMREDEMVTLLLQAGADINEILNVQYRTKKFCPHERGMTFLHWAVAHRNIPKITFFLEHGANVNAPDYQGNSPLQAALLYQRYEIAEILLDAGASVDSANNRGETVLQAALLFCEPQMVSIILDHKPELNVTDRTGRNALHYLAQADLANMEIARRILKEGVLINQPDTRSGVTPLHVALLTNKPDLIHLFLQHGAEVNLIIKCGYTALILAAALCSPYVMRLLLKRGANPDAMTDTGETALHKVCRQNCVDKINVLLEHGADINTKGESGKTAIENLSDFRMEAAQALIKHISKLESSNLFIDESILRFIDSNESLKNYHDSCMHELQFMKNLTFYNNFSFHYVLKISTETLSKLIANEEFTEKFKLFDVILLFSWYGNELDSNFQKAEQKMLAYKRMTKHLSLVFYHKYDSVIEHIVKYLKPSDLPMSLV